MTGLRLEDRRHLAAFSAGAHQRSVAPRTEGERERVEQDRLAGAGLAGQHG